MKKSIYMMATALMTFASCSNEDVFTFHCRYVMKLLLLPLPCP